MPELTPDNLFFVVSLFMPGFIIGIVRSQFIKTPAGSDNGFYLHVLCNSAVNYGICSPVIYYLLSTPSKPTWLACSLWLCILFIIPLITGALWGISRQKEWVYSLLRTLKVSPIHLIPSAWDWKFGRMNEGSFVLVTLKDGTEYAGWVSGGSFMSSDSNERDMYIEKMYKIDGKQWTDRGNDSVLICGGEIRSVEFLENK